MIKKCETKENWLTKDNEKENKVIIIKNDVCWIFLEAVFVFEYYTRSAWTKI